MAQNEPSGLSCRSFGNQRRNGADKRLPLHRFAQEMLCKLVFDPTGQVGNRPSYGGRTGRRGHFVDWVPMSTSIHPLGPVLPDCIAT